MFPHNELTRKGGRSVRWPVAVLVAGLLFPLAPATALAQGFAQAVVYEVIESPPPRPSTGGQAGAFPGLVTRLAQATLIGSVLAAFGSLSSWLGGEIDSHAQSQVSLVPGPGFGSGPFQAVFTVSPPGGSGVISGKLSGILNMSMLLSENPIPLAPVAGTWATLGKLSSRLGGSFEGTAQVPFVCGLLPDGSPAWCYLDPVTFTPSSLIVGEFPQGEFKGDIPLVRFLLFVTED